MSSSKTKLTKVLCVRTVTFCDKTTHRHGHTYHVNEVNEAYFDKFTCRVGEIFTSVHNYVEVEVAQ